MPNTDKAQQKFGVLYVGNLPSGVSETEIRELFAQHGYVHSVMLPPPKEKGEASRVGWVTMKKANSAITALDESSFAGRRLQVKLMGFWVPEDMDLPAETMNSDRAS